MVKKLGIYIHLPFCVTKCEYCDFYSVTQGESLMNEYQKALLAHMKTMSSATNGYQVDTIYFGGGTPTYYGANRIDSILRVMKKTFRVERDAEITVEGNPESLTLKTVQTLKRCGVNRISLGMQSAKEGELQSMGRPHTSQQTREAVGILKSCKVKNLSLDLIYGLPQQTPEDWEVTLEEAIALEPQHLSCYGLKVEEGTPLALRVAQGEVLPEEDVQADIYLWTVDRLARAGYQQYEISNFAQAGFSSRHNLGYWKGKPYLGFGASAASDFGGYRYSLVADITAYCNCVLEGGGKIFDSNALMSERERLQEYIMLRLRTVEGISAQEYHTLSGRDFTPLQETFEKFAQQGWAVSPTIGHWHLSAEGFLRSNQLIGLLLEQLESSQSFFTPPILIEPTKPLLIFSDKQKQVETEEKEEKEEKAKKSHQHQKTEEVSEEGIEQYPFQENEDGQFHF